MRQTLARINQAVWELGKLIAKNPESYDVRADFLRFFHEARLFNERKKAVPEADRSFLLLQEREAPACLLLHGVGGSPAEMRPLAEHLNRAGYTVYGLRLALADDASAVPTPRAAGRLLDSLRRRSASRGGYNVERCVADTGAALDAMLMFSPNTCLAGFSFGGTLALRLMGGRPVRGAVLLAPGLFPASDLRLRLFSAMRSVVPFVARGGFPREYALLRFSELTRERLSAVEQPVLVVQAARDRVVSPKGLRFIEQRSKNPKSRFVMLESDRHVIVTGDGAQNVFNICTDFLREI